MFSWRFPVSASLLVAVSALSASAQGPVRTPRVHALIGARIVVEPGRVIDRGTIVVRDGILEAVGAQVAIPADARIWKMDSLTVYAGLIDPAMVVSPAGTGGEEERSGGGPPRRSQEPRGTRPGVPHELGVVTPELVLADRLQLKDGDRKTRLGQGITTVRAIPEKGVLRGQAAILNLGEGDLSRNLLRREAGQVFAFDTEREDTYPNSTMGAVAVLRQAILDTRWYREAHEAYAARPAGLERPPVNAAWEALAGSFDRKEPLIFVTDDVLDVLRAQGIEREFGLAFGYVGSGEEYKRLADLGPLPQGIVIPVNYPDAPSVDDPGAALSVSLETLRHWEAAPANAAKVRAAGVLFAWTANGLKDAGQFRKNVAKAVAAGLPEDAALAAATTVPAGILGLEDRLGTVEAGKIANLVVTDGPIFSDSTRVRAVWIDGAYVEVEEVKPPKGDPRGTWEMSAGVQGQSHPFTLVLGGEPGALTGTVKMMGNDVAATVAQSGSSVTVAYSGESIGLPGMIRFTFSFAGDGATGSGTSPMGEFTVSGTRTAKPGSPGESAVGSGIGGAR